MQWKFKLKKIIENKVDKTSEITLENYIELAKKI